MGKAPQLYHKYHIAYQLKSTFMILLAYMFPCLARP